MFNITKKKQTEITIFAELLNLFTIKKKKATLLFPENNIIVPNYL